jgi:RimJ/RimL family protein N-acetyltransferase
MRLPLPLQTKRLIIKEFTEHDEESYNQFLTDKDYIKNLGYPQKLQQVIEEYRSEEYILSGLGILMAYEDSLSKVIGLCGLQHDSSGEGKDIGILYAVLTQFRGQGYATEIARKLREVAFEVLELDRVVARVNPDNAASVRILEKLGMTYFQPVLYSFHGEEEHLYDLDKQTYVRLKNS